MFLNLLQKTNEKALFLKLAYLIAVAHSEEDENSAEVSFKFEYVSSENVFSSPIGTTFAPVMVGASFGTIAQNKKEPLHKLPFNFLVTKDEQEMLFSYAKELEAKVNLNSSLEFSVDVPGYSDYGVTSLEEVLYANINLDENTFSNKSILTVAKKSNNLTEMLKTACEEIHVEGQAPAKSRHNALELSLAGIIASCPEALSLQSKKIILFELTAMAYADGNYDPEEKYLLNLLYKHFDIDIEMRHDFEGITQKFSSLAKEAIDIITE